MTESEAPRSVTRRRVFYIAGFDPRPVGIYARTMREQGEAYAALHERRFAMGKRKDLAPHLHRWELSMLSPGAECETEYDFLVWNDLVSQRMDRALPEIYRMALGDLLHFLRLGLFRRVWAADRRMFGCLIYPYWLLPAFLGASVLAGLWAYGLVQSASGLWPAGLLAGFAVAGLLMLWVARNDGRHFALWLAHYYRFAREEALGSAESLVARRAAFAREIREARASGRYKEVLVVGHSAGALQAVLTLDEGVEESAGDATPLGLITIGQNTSLFSLNPEAERARAALARLAARRDLTWVDISSGEDWISFTRLDPTLAADMPAIGQKTGPIVLGAGFRAIFSRKQVRWGRMSVLRGHFLFFHANAEPGLWDWYDIILGQGTLAERFRGASSAVKASRMQMR